MKRSIFVITLSIFVLVTGIIWLLNGGNHSSSWFTGQFVVISILVAISLIGGIKLFKASTLGEPHEDELTKRLLEKGASKSFFISLFWWIFLINLKDRITVDGEELIGTGIIGMGVILVVNVLILKFKGFNDEE